MTKLINVWRFYSFKTIEGVMLQLTMLHNPFAFFFPITFEQHFFFQIVFFYSTNMTNIISLVVNLLKTSVFVLYSVKETRNLSIPPSSHRKRGYSFVAQLFRYICSHKFFMLLAFQPFLFVPVYTMHVFNGLNVQHLSNIW